jgi:6-phosphogluconolactonase
MTHRPTTQPHWVTHTSPDTATQALELAQDLAAHLREAIQSRGQALLAVSGGRSPVALFHALRTQPLDWSRVTVLLVDERCVNTAHADSNSALVQQHLLQEAAQAAQFVPFFTQLPESDGSLSEQQLQDLSDAAQPRLAALAWPLDAAVLGMGEDGHTASLFPGAAGLEHALSGPRPLTWTRPATAPHARLTLTLPTLLAARHLVLPLQGQTKAAVFASACQGPTPQLPISLVLHGAAHPVHVWQTD